MSKLINAILHTFFPPPREVVSPEIQDILSDPVRAKKLMEAIKDEERNVRKGKEAVGESGGYTVRRVGHSKA